MCVWSNVGGGALHMPHSVQSGDASLTKPIPPTLVTRSSSEREAPMTHAPAQRYSCSTLHCRAAVYSCTRRTSCSDTTSVAELLTGRASRAIGRASDTL